MLWKPSTSGEQLFLLLHEAAGGALRLSSDADTELDFLLSAQDFSDFVKLSATTEVFVRCVRAARIFHELYPNSSATETGKELRKQVDLPMRLWADREFCELARLTGMIANRKPRNKNIEKAAMSQVGAWCYMCGGTLDRHKNGSNRYTIEHLWPIGFGGETNENNLLPACAPCNSQRQHMLSWASGPVQSTFLHSQDPPSKDLKTSLALARLLHFASSGRKRKTLKEAALEGQPLHVGLNLNPGRHHLYFELLSQVRSS